MVERRQDRGLSSRRGGSSASCDGNANKKPANAEHGFMNSSTLDGGSDHGNDCCDGDTPFPAEVIDDGSSNRHGDDRTSKDNGHI